MKKLIITAVAASSLFTLSACSNDDSEVVAETDAGDITKSDFYDEMKDRYGDSVLQDMVEVKVLSDKYDDVTQEDADEEVDKMKEQYGDQFEMLLQQQGFGDEENFRRVMYTSMLREAAASEDIDISDEEIEKEYDLMKKEFKVQHILVDDEETAKEIEDKLDDGDDFGDLAEEYSTDQGTAEQGGDLGYVTIGAMAPEQQKLDPKFDKAVQDMDEDEISDPVKTEHGVHVIKLNDIREKDEDDVGSLEDNKEDIRRALVNEKVDMDEAQEKLDSIMDDADVDVKDDDLEDLFDSEGNDADNDANDENSDSGNENNNGDNDNNSNNNENED